ncbi:hypothetical protein VC218_02955 [Xanthomonas nasturtii]|nr:hypothetical protein [Xanthomonas nasturtii]
MDNKLKKIYLIVALLASAIISQTVLAQEPSFYNCQNKAIRVNIPSMPLGKAVARFTELTRCPVSIDADEVANTDVKELPTFIVKGKLTPRKALDLMLSSTPLKAKEIRGGFSIYEDNNYDSKP